ncbi:hypothetical protein PTSG_09053 [Salpingoeca rosetta]|uniref:Phosphatidic acid phosphatase type 2/haloperoxidase domain-containing protein n=1 Tax=Salpingoeca rosetta (strain ATCC 50818 / BSB-021) TaxID=946362 RepID=F2UM28_SALR5|nr:uncharacterized protein PTSG_09053 [Salpingoeca rosetta]EGD78177.1 hypothetical protein PTSG_09053 [Salpingoeca rosetta]|eukprot:XP_004989853.1 hypothetical protein PTSG_09053 [Salpingoeca rosetta]
MMMNGCCGCCGRAALVKQCLLALNTWTPRLLVGSCLAYMALDRTRYSLLFVAGSLLDVAVGKLVKRVVDEGRPATSKKQTRGMPSTHANSLFYFAVSTHLTLYNAFNNPPSRLLRDAVPALGYVWAASVAYTRVSLTGDHTPPQVVAGAALGTAFALGWHQIALA